MNEHQVVVVFDVTASELLSAGEFVKLWLANDQRRADFHVESWWMPEEPLRSQVDGNDNAAGRLVFDSEPLLDPAERIALTVAHAQVRRGEQATPNVAAVCVMALARVAESAST